MSRTITLFAAVGVAVCLMGCAGAPEPAPASMEPQGWYPHEGGLLKYRVQIRFGFEPENTMPKGWYFGRVSAVATDSSGEVYVFQRGEDADPIVVFDKDGKYLRSWGRDLDFGNEHGLRVDPDDNVWITDNGNHQVMKFTREGKLLLTLGVRGESGEDDKHFFRPADITFGPDGSVYVADGYGNARVVKFSPEGEYITAWGKHGTGESEFNIVHSAAVDSKGTVYVSDRENNRIQIFDADGKFLRMWTHLGATQNIFITLDDEMWIITHRDNIENITYDTLAGRIMNIDMETGRIIGAMESPGHWIHVTPEQYIFIGSLSGNVFRWYPGWMEGKADSEEGLKPAY
jgi:outer membrane protein assembly factor BamB